MFPKAQSLVPSEGERAEHKTKLGENSRRKINESKMHTVFGPSGSRGIYALSMANHRPDPRDTGAFPLTAGGHQGVTRNIIRVEPLLSLYFF